MTGFFFFKQKTAYEMRISDWSSDVCSSDLGPGEIERDAAAFAPARDPREHIAGAEADIEDAPRAVADTTRPDPVEKAQRRSRRQRQRVDPRQVGETARIAVGRSEERRVGKECVSTGRARWAQGHIKNKQKD